MFNHMVEHQGMELDLTFHALSDPTRRAILKMLSGKGIRVTDIARPFPHSLNAISKHLKVLEQAKLIRREVKGRDHLCLLEPGPLHSASDWFSQYRQFWEEKLDAMEHYIIENRKTRGRKARRKSHAGSSSKTRNNRRS